MPLKSRSQIREPKWRRLDLPPPFQLVMLREAGDAFAHARAHATELGAGALVLVGRFDLAEFAVVLEPEEPLASARRVFYVGMIALADTLAAKAPPEKPIWIEWPDAVYVDGGLIGGGRLGCPEHTDEHATPDWLVFGVTVRTALMREPGPDLCATALAEEGYSDVDAGHFAEGFARHLMVALDRWQEAGFAPVARDYVARLARRGETMGEINEVGDLEVQDAGKLVERRWLRQALEHPSWLDPQTGEPRLR